MCNRSTPSTRSPRTSAIDIRELAKRADLSRRSATTLGHACAAAPISGPGDAAERPDRGSGMPKSLLHQRLRRRRRLRRWPASTPRCRPSATLQLLGRAGRLARRFHRASGRRCGQSSTRASACMHPDRPAASAAGAGGLGSAMHGEQPHPGDRQRPWLADHRPGDELPAPMRADPWARRRRSQVLDRGIVITTIAASG